MIKAKAVCEKIGLPTLADDSGICVDALNGEPGIYSARYAGDGDDNHNNQLLLKNIEHLTDKKDRSAKFVCCMVFYKPNGEIVTSMGETHGYILREPEGVNGFGYDPIFVPEGYDLTFAELGNDIKNTISHRARAVEKLCQFLKK